MCRFREIVQSIKSFNFIGFSVRTDVEPPAETPQEWEFAKHWSLEWVHRCAQPDSDGAAPGGAFYLVALSEAGD